jgi:Ankyrin repeats (many copies)
MEIKVNRLGQTALMLAVDSQNLAGIQSCLAKTPRDLLDHNADDGLVNATDDWGRTALMYAAHSCNAAITQLLLDHGANVNLQDQFGETALIKACKAERLPVCTLLVQRGADMFHRNQSGWSPLSMAKRLDTLYVLLRADPTEWTIRRPHHDLLNEMRADAAPPGSCCDYFDRLSKQRRLKAAPPTKWDQCYQESEQERAAFSRYLESFADNMTPKVNRDRNREHARTTRLRKKAYLEKLQATVDDWPICG